MNKILMAALTILLLVNAGSELKSQETTNTTETASSFQMYSDGGPPM